MRFFKTQFLGQRKERIRWHSTLRFALICILAGVCELANIPAAHARSKITAAWPEFGEWFEACTNAPTYLELAGRYPPRDVLPLPTLVPFHAALQAFLQTSITGALADSKNWFEGRPSADFYNLSKAYFLRNGSSFEPFVQRLALPPESEVILHADLHGDIHSLVNGLKWLNDQSYFRGFTIARSNLFVIFLGDYTDRGVYGVEVLYTLLRLKLENPNRVFLVRGNHEDIQLAANYGFLAEGNTKYGNAFNPGFVCRLYDFLPAAIYLGCGTNYVQCSHGGVEPGLNPGPFLDSPGFDYFRITRLSQKTFLQTHERFRQLIGDAALARLGSQFVDGVLTSPTTPFSLGLMWNDFSIAPGQPGLDEVKDRALVYGEEPTRYVLEKSSGASNRLRAIFRGHQHSIVMNPMMARLLASRGVFRHWQTNDSAGSLSSSSQTLASTLDQRIEQPIPTGSVWTLNVAPYTPYGQRCPFSFDAFACLKLSRDFEQWRVRRITLIGTNGSVRTE